MTAFLSGISVFCFAASYAVALACEASRLVFRSGVRGAVMVGFAAAGLLAHTLFLGWRAATEAALPLSSPFDWYLLAAWLLAAVYLYLTVTNPRTPVGLFMLPVVLALVGAAQASSRVPFPQSPATQVWAARLKLPWIAPHTCVAGLCGKGTRLEACAAPTSASTTGSMNSPTGVRGLVTVRYR